MLVFPLLFAITTVLERKGLGRIQNRYGPNRVGIYGFGQPIADGIKSLTKEDVIPRDADHVVHLLAPLVLVMAAFLAYSVLPIGRNMVIVNLDAGVLFFFAIGSMVELAVFMAGWSMRAVAQMISYEVPLVLASVVVIMAAGSLSTVSIVEKQTGYTWGLPHWYVFTPWGFVGFVLFMIAATAESNRSPFDLPEGESEIIAGYYIEYSGFKFALFATSALAITLFLGGWSAPFSFLTWVPSYIWFFLKLLVIIAAFIWVRGTFPRLRMDQLMGLAWKFMLPMTLLNILTAGAWQFLPTGIVRWVVCSAMVILPLIFLSRGLKQSKTLQVRTYRYAD
jgi:NADH-quinone oxidoreductase subunit H